MRLIDADALVEYFEGLARSLANARCFNSADAIKGAAEKVTAAPTIDAEPARHGRWEWYEYWGDAAFRDPPEIYDAGWACSACGTALLQYLQSHFPDIPSYTECASEEKPTLECCPCCGAKMDAKEDNHADKETNDLAG